jgi:hypothetical protein
MRKSGVKTLLAKPGRPPAYQSLLIAADSIRVTADSVSMVSDAIWTGKPLALVPIVMSRSGRIVFALHDRLRPGSRVYPQDLRSFWKTLGEIGIGNDLARPTTSTNEVTAAVAARVFAILAAT